MKKWFVLFALVFIMGNMQAQVPVIKLSDLQKKIKNNSDTVYVINFWATWCSPCVKELPEFEHLNALYRKQKFKMILVSLDFKKEAGRVRNFVAKNNLGAEVVLLDETKYNEWIDKIDTSWSGAIPSTLILKNSTRYKLFKEKSLTFEELESFVKPLL